MYEAEESHVRKLLEEVLDEESNVEVGYESDFWSDHQSDSDHKSESEDDADPENTSDSAAGNQVSNLMGKDGTTEWSIVVPTKNKRTRSCNIIRTHLPCVRREFKNCKSPIDCFQLYATDDMLEIVVENTNKYIDTVSVNYSDRDKYKVKRTTLSEIKACIGLLYMAGVFKPNRQNLDDVWANDETGTKIFRFTVSLQHFRFLLQCLHFDDRTRSLAMDLMRRTLLGTCSMQPSFQGTADKNKQRITSPAREQEVKLPKLQGRCAICPRSKDRKTKYMCQKCKKSLCLQHVIPFSQFYKKLTQKCVHVVFVSIS